jgi:hypothetical protein
MAFVVGIFLRLPPAFLVASMMLLPLAVKAQEKPVSSHRNSNEQEISLKDSVKEPSIEFSKLLEVLMTTGEEGQLSENLAPTIGLTGSPYVKGKDFTTRRSNGKEYRECSIVYADGSNSSKSPDKKKPFCVYFNKQVVSGKKSESYWYRLNLQGTLEKVAVIEGKYDENGKPVQGSGITVEKDIDSPEVLKAFKAEFSYWTKDWLKKQQKAAAPAESAAKR